MLSFKRTASAAVAALLAMPSYGANVTTAFAPIKKIISYADYGSGDVAIWTDTGIAGCEHGVWISSSSPGAKNLTAIVVIAYSTGKEVRFQVLDTERWGGSSSSNLCRAAAVRYE